MAEGRNKHGGGIKEIMQTAPCRYCGQMVQFAEESDLTEHQAQEIATMKCRCEEAVHYQKEKQRKENALKNVSKLFGEDAPIDKRVKEDIVKILMAAVEQVYEGGVAKIVLNLRGGVKASVTQNSKGELNVERVETKKQKLTD